MFAAAYLAQEPSREAVEAMPGDTLLEFGAPWCGHCIAAQGAIEAALDARALRHLKVEDGRGRPLGRALRVKLWPTLVLLRDGAELARVVRPTTRADVERLFADAAA